MTRPRTRQARSPKRRLKPAAQTGLTNPLPGITTPGNGRNAGSTGARLPECHLGRYRPDGGSTQRSRQAWERFNRGETGVFTREIYTRQGQPTFEEIQRKYAREPEFRQTVDRYVEEFERLLREVARDDRDRLLTRSYLVSETGKVLYHAGPCQRAPRLKGGRGTNDNSRAASPVGPA